jgi:hypothetical protein
MPNAFKLTSQFATDRASQVNVHRTGAESAPESEITVIDSECMYVCMYVCVFSMPVTQNPDIYIPEYFVRVIKMEGS